MTSLPQAWPRFFLRASPWAPRLPLRRPSSPSTLGRARWEADLGYHAEPSAHDRDRQLLRWTSKRGGDPGSCNATVAFDIDETLLSNCGYYKSTGFTFDQDGWNAFNEACKNSAIAPARDLYRKLLRDGFSVVLMTGHPEADRSWTASCLRERGIRGWHELILRTPAEASLSADVYKSQNRADLQREGHRIVASIGDQVSDMSMGRLKAGFLLPNLMYFIP